ncbi:hypothetical protein OS493_007162 [Desmophyllum pertusum]|uniref:Uncharacterized protein n=1 Tax=Desmophyllum pertusum TaxID=174260 RepID=A0A9W9ZFP7_9CNID|nr:hypothetical protein OS493_007162 [Desmophyllum pertusum]
MKTSALLAIAVLIPFPSTLGSGVYIYIETSLPRKQGDIARLESPWMRGPQCMMFYYHMFGSTMSCVVIYIRSHATNRSKPVWLKSQNQGARWIQGQLSINETTSYQIIIDGIRGSNYHGDAALDDFTFQRGTCQQTDLTFAEETTYYVSSYKGKDFRVSTQPFERRRYSEEFRFTLEHSRGNPRETPYFLYAEASSRQSFVTSRLDHFTFPLDVVVLNNEALRRNSRKIYLIDRRNYSPMISLYEHRNVTCCKLNFSFYAFDVTETGNRSISGCAPGWYKAGRSCYLFYFQLTRKWRNTRNLCHKLGADLAVVNNAVTLEALANQRREIKLDDRDFYLGLSSKLRWIWLDGKNASIINNLWGPNEPSGQGRCVSFLIRKRSSWTGYGWRWNDESCTNQKNGYICEQPLAVPMPVALFSLSGTNGTLDISPNGVTKAVSSNITFAPGPFGNPNGSLFFSGIKSSYVELNNTGELDTRFSISVFAWVNLGNSSGPIFNYGCSMWVSHLTLGVEVRYVDRKSSKIRVLHKTNVIEANAWNFIGTTYDYHTGFATVWVNDNIVMLRSVGAKMELATQSNVRVGASRKQETHFRGRISCLQFYDQALSEDQINKVKARCNQTKPLSCSPNFFHFHGGCFYVNTKNVVNWNKVLAKCNRKGGTLAKISREGLRYAFSNMLDEMRPKPKNLHIGMLAQGDWVWIDGSPLNGSLWMPGYPTIYKKTQSCATVYAIGRFIKDKKRWLWVKGLPVVPEATW